MVLREFYFGRSDTAVPHVMEVTAPAFFLAAFVAMAMSMSYNRTELMVMLRFSGEGLPQS
jgi:hypothetical protein